MDTIYTSLRQELTCAFLCERELIKDPVVLQNCGHIFCFECVKGWLKSRKRTCPICRTKIKEAVIDTDKVGVIPASALQPNPQLKTVFGLIEILLSQEKQTQKLATSDLIRSLQQLQIETNNLKIQRKAIEERSKVLYSSSEDEDEDTAPDPNNEDYDYSPEDPLPENDFDAPPTTSNNSTPLRKSTRRNKN